MNDDDKYKLFYLKNSEFPMDIDVSHLECGMNGAVYFVEMDEQGGTGLGHKQAGAKYGTGYCDAQCTCDIKFIEGEANTIGWKPNPKDEDNSMGAAQLWHLRCGDGHLGSQQHDSSIYPASMPYGC